VIPTTSALPGSGVTLSERALGDSYHVGFAGVRGQSCQSECLVIPTTSALPGLEVKGQGSIFTSPARYKGEQNGARGSLEGSENRTELKSAWKQ